MSYKALFTQTVRAAQTLPASLRDHADDVTALEEHRFNRSYIEFLDEQIRLSPRGPEWTERLKHRRADLLPFCDATLLRGRVRVGEADFTVEIDPKTRAVIHWEQYEFDHVA
jgi:hypothetical protein